MTKLKISLKTVIRHCKNIILQEWYAHEMKKMSSQMKKMSS